MHPKEQLKEKYKMNTRQAYSQLNRINEDSPSKRPMSYSKLNQEQLKASVCKEEQKMIYDTPEIDSNDESDDSYVSVGSEEMGTSSVISCHQKKSIPRTSYDHLSQSLRKNQISKKHFSSKTQDSCYGRPFPQASQWCEEQPECLGSLKKKNPDCLPGNNPAPSPLNLLPICNEIPKSSSCVAPGEEYVSSSEEMNLGDFVSKYQNDFPVQIRVSRGFYGTSDKWSLSEDEYFNIHFIKKTKVVSVSDGTFGTYNIPINSSTMFGYLYGLDENVDKSISGYNFSTINSILQAETSPPIVKAQKNFHHGRSSDHSVNVGDVLLVQEAKGRLKRSLKCLDMKTGMTKILHPNCEGDFTTCPYGTRLFLPEIVQHFSLPATFIMYVSTHSKEERSFSHRVQLLHCSVETSVIATQLDRRIDGENSPIEIPMDLDIGVEVVIPREADAARLFDETGKLYETLDIASIQTIPSNSGNSHCFPVPMEAMVTCHEKNKNIGVEIQQPPRYTTKNGRVESVDTVGKKTNRTKKKVRKTDELVPETDFADGKGLETKFQHIESLIKDNSLELERLSVHVSDIKKRQESLLAMCSSLRNEFGGHKLPDINSIAPPLPIKKPSVFKSKKVGNLEQLSLDQVMKVLHNLRLHQYQPLFRSQNINGKQLMKMTEGDLSKLGVAVEHQGPILNIIDGHILPPI